jgi:hypothetical protein
MSQITIVSRGSSVDADKDDCRHGMNPAWCAECRKPATGGSRIQVQVTGCSCSECGGYLHRGDIITMKDGHRLCPDCS